jgi:hypothetical protein
MTNLWWWGCGWECLAWMRDGLLAAIVRLLRWQELAMTNLWWWECLAWMHDGLLATIVRLLRWQEPGRRFFVVYR